MLEFIKNKNFSEEDFKKAKSRELLEFTCIKCNKTFFQDKHRVQHGISKFIKSQEISFQFCSKECHQQNRKDIGLVKVKCKNCQKIFTRQKRLINGCGNKFCSQSCAATFNNKIYIKKEKIYNSCECCSATIPVNRSYCNKCVKKGKHLGGGKNILDRTLGEIIGAKEGCSRYTSIRSNARTIMHQYTNMTCQYCGYSTHVDICHIKPINSYSLDTKVSVINDVSNLLCLCKNHHWEFDNGILPLEEIKNH